MEKLRETVEHIEELATLMDSQFKLPGTSINLGLDALVGLIPVVGDTLNLGVAGYIVSRAAAAGVPKRHLTRMSWNIFIDWLIGLVPLIGDLFDVGWKANLRNARILRKHFEKELARRPDIDVLPPETPML